MKKIFLSAFAVLVSSTMFAQSKIESSKISVNNTPVKTSYQTPKQIVPSANQGVIPAKKSKVERRADEDFEFIRIGGTLYDLQSNASMGKRIIVHPDGTISAVWTTAVDNFFTSRGTGYNHFDGTDWGEATEGPTPRVEADFHTGWPSIGLLSDNKEFVMGHFAAEGGFVFSTNSSIGDKGFGNSRKILQQSNSRPIWGRAGTSGDYIHVISNYSDSSAPGDPIAPTIDGVRAPLTYSRSIDGGDSWDIEHVLLPGYDSIRWTTGSADDYAIDVKDSIVAIVTGRLGTDVALWKSTDNGTTFTHMYVDSFPYGPLGMGVVTVDTPTTSDGTLEVIIDNDGKCHVWYGLSRVHKDDPESESFFFFPGTAGLAYWNEDMENPELIANGAMFDRDGDEAYNIEGGTISFLESGNIPSGLISVARLGSTCVIRQPTAGIDNDGNLFVAFSVPLEGALDYNMLNYRAIYIMYSTDGGATWGAPQAVTKLPSKENDFPSMARVVNDFVHIIFQQDDIPGTNLQNNSNSASNHPIDENDIMYAAIPTQDILDDKLGPMWGLSVREVNKSSNVFVVSQNAPNPFTNQTNITIYLNDFTPNLNITVKDITGRTVFNNNVTNLNSGNHIITIDASTYSSGIYFYTLTAGNNTVTKKMIVE